MSSGTMLKTMAAAAFLVAAPAAALAGPTAYQPKHVSAAELPAFTEMSADAAPAAAFDAPQGGVAEAAGNQVPAPASLGIFALAAAGILGTRARRRRTG